MVSKAANRTGIPNDGYGCTYRWPTNIHANLSFFGGTNSPNHRSMVIVNFIITVHSLLYFWLSAEKQLCKWAKWCNPVGKRCPSSWVEISRTGCICEVVEKSRIKSRSTLELPPIWRHFAFVNHGEQSAHPQLAVCWQADSLLCVKTVFQ